MISTVPKRGLKLLPWLSHAAGYGFFESLNRCRVAWDSQGSEVCGRRAATIQLLSRHLDWACGSGLVHTLTQVWGWLAAALPLCFLHVAYPLLVG